MSYLVLLRGLFIDGLPPLAMVLRSVIQGAFVFFNSANNMHQTSIAFWTRLTPLRTALLFVGCTSLLVSSLGCSGSGNQRDDTWQDPRGDFVAVEFDSTPRGALVLVDGRLLCRTTPCSRAVPRGEHTVEMLLEEHLAQKRTIGLAQGEFVEWELEPNFGLVNIKSEQEGLILEIDGEVAGQTPLTDKSLKPGSHKVRIQDKCYQNTLQEFSLQRGEHLDIELTATPQTRTIQIEVNDPKGKPTQGTVTLDNEELGEAPGNFEVPVCGRLLRVHNENYQFQTVLTPQSNKTSIRAILGSGYIKQGGIEYSYIPSGDFQMGSPSPETGRDADEVLHKVSLRQPFLLQSTEVTQKQWNALMGNNPSQAPCPNCPIENVNWWDAVSYLNALSKHENLETCYELLKCVGKPGETNYACQSVSFKGLTCQGYRLPTEAEWEYAARARTQTALANGPLWVLDPSQYDPFLDLIGVYATTNEEISAINFYDVLQANAFGLRVMHGSAAEWVWDGFSAVYNTAELVDPIEPPTLQSNCVSRGGDGESFASETRAASRREVACTEPNGMRLARTYPLCQKEGCQPFTIVRDRVTIHFTPENNNPDTACEVERNYCVYDCELVPQDDLPTMVSDCLSSNLVPTGLP